MAILSCNFNSSCLGRTVSFQAILPVNAFSPESSENTSNVETERSGRQLSDNQMPDSQISNKQKPLKTLYLLHGITGNDIDWLIGTRVAHYAQSKGLAVIMPAGENGFYTDNNSTNRFGEYVGRELVHATRSMFHLSEKREDTFIGGLSMGGYGALRNGLKYSGTFGKIVALSSALVVGKAATATNEPNQWHFAKKEYFDVVFGDPDKLEGGDLDVKALAANHARHAQIYMACGTEDTLLEKNREFRDYLQSIEADLDYVEAPGDHDWKFWDTYIEKGIEWLYKK